MADPDDLFVRKWTITSWKVTGSLIEDLFAVSTPLEITRLPTPAPPAPQMDGIAWGDTTGDGHKGSFPAPFDRNPPARSVRPFPVRFTLTGMMTLELDAGGNLIGKIYKNLSLEGPVGTFIADANPDDERSSRKGDRGHRKSPGWRHWLRRLLHRLDKLLAKA